MNVLGIRQLAVCCSWQVLINCLRFRDDSWKSLRHVTVIDRGSMQANERYHCVDPFFGAKVSIWFMGVEWNRHLFAEKDPRSFPLTWSHTCRECQKRLFFAADDLWCTMKWFLAPWHWNVVFRHCSPDRRINHRQTPEDDRGLFFCFSRVIDRPNASQFWKKMIRRRDLRPGSVDIMSEHRFPVLMYSVFINSWIKTRKSRTRCFAVTLKMNRKRVSLNILWYG